MGLKKSIKDYIISIVLYTPLAGMLILLVIPPTNSRAIRLWASAAGLLGFLVSMPLVFGFDPAKDYRSSSAPIGSPPSAATYHIGIDGLGLLLVMLTTLLGWISILSSWNAIRERLKEYYALFLMLQTAMLGVFMSLDFLLFFIFREPVLVPMYFIIAIWGPRRTYAAIKFIIYTLITLIGSVLMLLGILTLYYQHTLRIRLAQLRYRPTCSRPTSHWASSGGSSGPFSWGLRSRRRCGRPTRGFLTPTSRRQLPVPSSWPAFC